MEERLQKLLSAAGICSRRAAEGYIAAGRVTVNGRAARVGDKADPDRDEILVDGKPLSPSDEPVYLMLNKPRGYVTTLSDEKGRKTVADLVGDCGARVWPVGRLDLDSEGLLLLTNDGELTHRLLHPSGEVNKTYQVWVYGPTAGAETRLASLRELEGEPIRPARVKALRRMCAACGLTVKRLRRVAEHTLTLGDLPPGHWRYLTAAETAALKET